MMSILRKSLLTFIIILMLTSQLFSQGTRITILHTNDLHAQFDPLPSSSSKIEARTNSGGFIALNHHLTVERNNKTLVLDGGDCHVRPYGIFFF